MAFQTRVNADLPLGIPGDFCAANPRATMLAGEGTLVVGPNPVTVGQFGFVTAAGLVSNSAAGYSRFGFIGARGQTVLITPYLGQFSMQVQPGMGITLHDSGPFFMLLANGGTPGQKIFASFTDGSASAGAAGSIPAGAAFTASIATTGVMTVTAVASGTLVPGAPVAGGAAPMSILNQLTSTAAGGALGSTGTYTVSPAPAAAFASGPLTTAGGIETRWYVETTTLPGTLAMTSTRN